MPRNPSQPRFSSGVYGVVGREIGYSQSPDIFRAVFDALGWNADYVRFDIDDRELQPLLNAMRTAPIRGLSVTKPYKESVLRCLDRLDDSARVVGAVNTVVCERGKLIGHNTDVAGVVAALGPHRKRLRDKDALIFGAGGGARAVAFALLKHLRMKSVTIAARRPAQARRLISDLQNRMPPAKVASAGFRPVADLATALEDARLVVNATPLGTDNSMASALLPRGVRLHAGSIAFDLVYRPRPTPFTVEARHAGCRHVVDGCPMLIAQAEAAFELWTGRRFPVDTRRRLLNARRSR